MNFLKFWQNKEPLNSEQCDSYLQSLEDISNLLARHGLKVAPYQDRSLNRIKTHRDPQRALNIWFQYADLLVAAEKEGDNLFDHRQLLWRMLGVLGYTPQSDIFSLIEKNHVIEIYTPDNWQIFRNLEFYKFVSMSLDEMATFHWPRDSKRSMKITIMGLEVATRLRFGTLRKTMDVRDWPEHQVQELLGKKWLLSIALQYISPLKGTNGEFAGLVLNNSKVISTNQ